MTDVQGNKPTTRHRYALLGGREIFRESLFTAKVYGDIMDTELTEYKSRIAHCGSCLSDQEYGHYLDECCCIHAGVKTKHEENEFVKELGFWKVPVSQLKEAEFIA